MTSVPPTPGTQHPTPSSTVAAILTPLGEGGIAVLHVAGPRAFELARELFRPKSGAPLAPDARRLLYGHIVDDDEVVDEVLVRLVSAGDAPGGEPRVEVNCHGGVVAVQRVLECFVRRGAEAAEPRAFVGRRARSAIEAEATEALIAAGTPLGAEVLLDQLDGALERALGSLPWERPAEAAAALDALLATERLARALWQPFRVAIAGPVNAGKSSLFNALAREERMIVSPTPGTTRDAVSALVAIGGVPFLLSDTAGLPAEALAEAGEREPGSAIEREAIARARAATAEADLVLLVLDGSAEGPGEHPVSVIPSLSRAWPARSEGSPPGDETIAGAGFPLEAVALCSVGEAKADAGTVALSRESATITGAASRPAGAASSPVIPSLSRNLPRDGAIADACSSRDAVGFHSVLRPKGGAGTVALSRESATITGAASRPAGAADSPVIPSLSRDLSGAGHRDGDSTPVASAQPLLVLNKCDLGLAPWARALASAGALAVSALTGAGLAELCEAIPRQTIGTARYEAGRPVVFTERQADLLAAAREAIEAGRLDEARARVTEAIGSRGLACPIP